MKPTARRDGLVIEDVEGEVVVYDRLRHRAHHLNRAAALVWQHCNGRNTVADLTNLLRSESSVAVGEELIWRALDRLGKARLLQERVVCPASAKAVTRRQALRKLGRTAAAVLAVPLITSVVAPTPLRADDDQNRCRRPPCSSACKNQCGCDGDCPRAHPVCRSFECPNPNCVGCKQKRCTEAGTPHEPDDDDDDDDRNRD